MYASMCYQSATATECFTTHPTGIRALTAMYTFMCSQNVRLSE